ncbi:MAG: hypothetical protein NZ550_03705 [Fimbriimonadales bacterium]|nr:hypothetical protein [Fimbriimonadales bacterium]
MRAWHATRYSIRALWQRVKQSRTAYSVLLGVLAGFVLWFVAKRTLPIAVREAMFWLAAALLAIWGAWLGVQVAPIAVRAYRFAAHKRYRESDRVVLSYDESLEAQADVLMQAAQRALHDAEQFLQTPLVNRTRVWVFVTPDAVYRQIYQSAPSYGGRAHSLPNIVEVVYTGDLERAYRTIAHEFAHLIVTQWRRNAPPLFEVGIAEATEFHDIPQRLHEQALYFMHYFPNCPLGALLNRQQFYNREWQYANYAWAGSFMRFLIERFGMPAVRRFYHRLADQLADEAFQAEFGMSLGQAELIWRDYLHTQLPSTTRREALGSALRDALVWAIRGGDSISRVRLLAEAMVADRPEFWLGYYGLAHYAFWQGDLEQALAWMEQAATAPEQEQTALRGEAWLQHGFVCDLLSKRERASECYRKALEFPDYDDEARRYHARARRYLETPYTYAERVQHAQARAQST